MTASWHSGLKYMMTAFLGFLIRDEHMLRMTAPMTSQGNGLKK